MAPMVNSIPRRLKEINPIILATNLHNVEKSCGIDSDAGMSISTLREDFIWVNNDADLISKLPTPSGINGGSAKVGGFGPMMVKSKAGFYLIDPEATFLEPSESQPNFRVMATQRLKRKE